MEVLVLDGKDYVKASKAARDLGYATDYVGQLCRSGQVDAHLIGRTWYVNKETLGSHKVEKKRISRVKAREQVQKAIKTQREEVIQNTPKSYRNIEIQYEEDTRELIPKTRKVSVKTDTTVARAIAEAEYEERGKHTLINEGEKIVMQGKIPVFDVTDGPADYETTYLHPKILRHAPERTQTPKKEPERIEEDVLTEPVAEEESVPSEEVVTETEPDIEKPLTFEERLAAEGVLAVTQSPEQSVANVTAENLVPSAEAPAVSVKQVVTSDTKSTSILSLLFILVLVTLVVVATLPITYRAEYRSSSDTTVTTFSYKLDEVIAIIQSKI